MLITVLTKVTKCYVSLQCPLGLFDTISYDDLLSTINVRLRSTDQSSYMGQ